MKPYPGIRGAIEFLERCIPGEWRNQRHCPVCRRTEWITGEREPHVQGCWWPRFAQEVRALLPKD